MLIIRTVQTRHQPDLAPIPNRLNQHFAVAAKDRVWATDFTFVPTRSWICIPGEATVRKCSSVCTGNDLKRPW